MIIKRYQEHTKTAEILKRFSILHVDQSAFSRATLAPFIERFNFIISKTDAVPHPYEILPAMNQMKWDCLLINYEACHYDFCLEYKKVKKQFPGTIGIIYNFSHSQFEKRHLVKANVNAILPVDLPIEEMLQLLEELSPNIVLEKYLVDKAILKEARCIIDNTSQLTDQHIHFIRAKCSGLSHKEIGKKYSISEQRVNNVFHDIRVFTGCSNSIDFIRFALMHEIVHWNQELASKAEAQSN